MTREDLEKYLHLKAEAEQLKEEVNKLKASLESPRSIVIDGMPRSKSGTNRTDEMIGKYLTLQESLSLKWQMVVRAHIRIEDALDRLDDVTSRMILRYRYIEGLTWASIATKMGYSESRIYDLHKIALGQAEKIEL